MQYWAENYNLKYTLVYNWFSWLDVLMTEKQLY